MDARRCESFCRPGASACERELPWRERTASCCALLLGVAAEDRRRAKCRSCALAAAPVADLRRAVICLDCLADPLPLDWCDAWGEYRGALEQLLRALKFERHDFLDDALASLLEETLRERGDLGVRCHRGRADAARASERRRGYNQAELLARALVAPHRHPL